VLDSALLRPGRFDRHIIVDVPDVRGRLGILKVHAKNILLNKRKVNLETIAKGTPGMVGADLANIVVYHGQIELDLIPGKIAESDLGLVTYIQSDATDLMLPLKLMEYMAVGIPALTVINKPIKYYFKTDELAYYESNNLESFTRELLNLIKSPPELSRLQKKTEIVNQRLNWENEQKNYINEIQKLTGIQTLW